MDLFDDTRTFEGKHADILHKYCSANSKDQKIEFLISDHEGNTVDYCIFDNFATCYVVAAALGIANNKKEDVDKSVTSNPANVWGEVIRKNKKKLMRVYYHMMFLETEEQDADSRIKATFSDLKSDDEVKSRQKLFDDYVRGGLTIIDETFKNCKSYEDINDTLIDLIDKYKEILEEND